MFIKNRILTMMVAIALCSLLFSGCGNSKSVNTTGEKLSVVCTIFPEYDWAREIIGELAENYDMTLIMDNGVDLHNYQPTAQDMAKIAACDVFVYVGGESDGWVEDAIKETTNPNMQVINLMDILGTDVKEEELVEGMQGEHDHDHEHEEGEEHEEDEVEYDEHVWLSLKNTRKIVGAMEQAFENVDSVNAGVYQQNSRSYIAKLDALDQDFAKAVEGANNKTVLFGDRFPFRYLVDDYGINYYAAFVGCSAETEASFETITFLAGKMDELGLDSIFVIEKSDKKIAQTVIENTKDKNQEILVLNSLQSVTKKDTEAGQSYLGIMQENLEQLKKVLN